MSNPAQIRKPSEVGLPVSLETHHEVTLFLYREARLLDEERYRDWLGLIARDIHYWMPLRENRFRKDRRPAPTAETSANMFNEHYDDLEDRVKRSETGMVWSDDPAPRLMRTVSNVEVFTTETPDELSVLSNVSIYRSRRQDEEIGYNAKRRDLIRRADGGWLIARRHVLVNHHVLLDENISLLF
jgi:3-phenylpropionate/cinnamic acid dioxygenase small subunit